jgi:hypothetical protein
VSDDDKIVEVVEGKNLGDRKTGSLPVKRWAGYPIANREYLGEVYNGGECKERMVLPL